MHNVRCYGHQCSGEFCFPLSPGSVTNFIDFQFHVTFGVCSRTLNWSQSSFLLQSWGLFVILRSMLLQQGAALPLGVLHFAFLCGPVCCMCERMSDGALPSPESRLQISRSHVLQWPLATFYSRPGLKGAPQLLMHPTHLVLRTLRLSSSFRNLENTSVIWWTETTVSNKV